MKKKTVELSPAEAPTVNVISNSVPHIAPASSAIGSPVLVIALPYIYITSSRIAPAQLSVYRSRPIFYPCYNSLPPA